MMAKTPAEKLRLDMQTIHIPYNKTGQGSRQRLSRLSWVMWPVVVAEGNRVRWRRMGRV